MKPYKYLAGLAMATLTLSGCTNLDETVYDQISSNNYFNTKEDVIAMAFRSFEHGYWTIVPRFRIQELPGDQLIFPGATEAGTMAVCGVSSIITHGLPISRVMCMTNGIPVLQESDNVISLLTDSAS